jgi:hypothetical protein
MGILLALLKGTTAAAAIMFAFALLKNLIIVFGFLFAIIKFAIIAAFLLLLVSIAISMIRSWSDSSSSKDA